MAKNLVVYFSKTGEQYGVGEISKGNTKIIAEIIAEKTCADIHEIKVANDNYPNTYNSLVKYAQQEKQENARPELAGDIENIDDYDNIFLGYPNWWGDMPMPVYSFFEKHDLSKRNVYHFCTHEGSGGVRRDGLALYGHLAQNNLPEAENKISDWLKSISF